MSWGETRWQAEGEIIEGSAEADDVQAVVLVDSSIGGEEILLVEYHAKVVHVQYLLGTGDDSRTLPVWAL